MRIRVPLHIKVMVSYLLVVGLVFLPSFLYLRVFQREEIRRRVASELVSEARAIGDRLASTPPDRLAKVMSDLANIVPQRLTVIDPAGSVLVDSVAGAPYPSHRDRPEVRQALEGPGGVGQAVRRSETTRQLLLYTAIRYPAAGPPQGVVRLAEPVASLDAASASGAAIVNRAGALALSAALILSLVAAVVVSRPLRRITASARAFATGDFGHTLDVDSDDELGDAARALEELASQLRSRLLSSGADRAALHALVDDLPVGVIVYDPRCEPFVIGARAREICDLAPHHDLERARQIARLEPQRRAIERLLVEGFTSEEALELPWRAGASLRARWIAVFSPEGERQPALVVMEEPPEKARLARAEALLRGAADRIRGASRRAASAPVAADLALLADELETELGPPSPAPSEVEAVAVSELCEAAGGELAALAQAGGIRIEMAVDDTGVRVVEAAGRTQGAVRSLLADAVRQAARGDVVVLRGEPADRRFRVSVRTSRPAAGMGRLERALQGLGGCAGSTREGDTCLNWLDLPRA